MPAASAGIQPAIFYGHGSPMNTLEPNRYTAAWRRSGEIGPRPRAILAISAHWYIDDTAVTAMPRPRTIHDFHGFPPALHAFEYPAPGDPALADRVRALLAPLPVRLDHDWGLDHGAWSVLAHAHPQADVPVVQLSLDARREPAFHHELGRRLAVLRDEGVRIVGSGNAVHHLGRAVWRPGAPPHDWASAFQAWVRDRVLRDEPAALIDSGRFAQASGPRASAAAPAGAAGAARGPVVAPSDFAFDGFPEAARLAVPTPEHYLPMLVVLGARRPDDEVTVLTEGIELGSIGMLSFALAPAAA
ncbi:MAG: 4,5-DOPA dioxygenase extradiol [Burkholderiaceae bacterium]|nr:4,5-DOPA dioxygenase extradiol [Burkholderiaceae bacterium]